MHDTSRKTVIYIWSARKFQSIFTIANENGGTFVHNCHKYELAGKVNYNRHVICRYGFVIDECQNYLEVRSLTILLKWCLR